MPMATPNTMPAISDEMPNPDGVGGAAVPRSGPLRSSVLKGTRLARRRDRWGRRAGRRHGKLHRRHGGRLLKERIRFHGRRSIRRHRRIGPQVRRRSGSAGIRWECLQRQSRDRVDLPRRRDRRDGCWAFERQRRRRRLGTASRTGFGCSRLGLVSHRGRDVRQLGDEGPARGEPHGRVGVERSGEDIGQRIAIGAGHGRHVSRDECGRSAAARHPLIGQRGQRELITRGRHHALTQLWRAVRSADGQAFSMSGENRPNAQAGQGRVGLRHRHVARMQGAVKNAPARSGVEHPGQRAHARNEVRQRGWAKLLQRHVQRVAFGERRRQIGRVAVQTRRQRHHGRGQRRRRRHQVGQGFHEAGQPFGRQVDSEELDGNGSV